MLKQSRRYSLHDSLGYQLTLAARLVERGFEDRLARHGLNRLFWCVLLAVGEEGLDAPSDIARFVGVDRTAVSRALRGMEGRGLIRRRSGRSDRRKRRVELTGQGQAALEASIPEAQANAREVAAMLSEEEQAALRAVLAHILEGRAGPVPRI